MSQLFDSLRRGRPSPPERQMGPGRTVKSDAVLATLGYSPPRRRSPGASAKPLIAVAVIAVACWLGWNWYSQSTTPAQQGAQRIDPAPGSSSADLPARSPQTVPGATAPTAEPLVQPPADVQEPQAGSVRPGTDAPPAALPTPGNATAPAPQTTARTESTPPDAPTASPSPRATPAPGRQAADLPRPTPPRTAVAAPAERSTAPRRAEPPPARERVPAPAAVTPPPPAPAPAPVDEVDHWSRALYYHRDGNFEKALQHYQAILARDDMNVQVRNNLGLLYQEKGFVDQAIREFRRALSIDPRYAPAHNNLGVALLRQGHADAAAAEFRTAIEIEPRNVDAMINRALAEKALGQRETAKVGLLRALVLQPRNAAAHYNLALLYEESGEAALAIRHYQSFLDNAGSEHADRAIEVRARLDVLLKRTAQF